MRVKNKCHNRIIELENRIKTIDSDIHRLIEYTKNGFIEHDCIDPKMAELGDHLLKMKAAITLLRRQNRELKKWKN